MLGFVTKFIGLYGIMAFFPVMAAKKTADPLSFIPVLAGLVVVVVFIIALALISKRMNLGFTGSRAIKVITALPLGTKERIVVIEVNGQQHLIGVTPQQINHLVTLDEPVNMDSPAGNVPGMSFQKILQGISKKND